VCVYMHAFGMYYVSIISFVIFCLSYMGGEGGVSPLREFSSNGDDSNWIPTPNLD
jgi:hypothetical protein